jgi:phosphotransferase system HPr (HPr) family protein
MICQQVKVNLSSGLHARPATNFVRLAKKFSSNIKVVLGDHQADPKSILELLSLGIFKDHVITISAEGADEAQAVEALCAFVKQEE